MKEMINKNDIWAYEREDGDWGIVIAETYENTLDELRKIYTDIDERLSEDWYKTHKWQYGLYVLELDEIRQSENGKVLITMPY